MAKSILDKIKTAKNNATPLISIETPDQSATIASIANLFPTLPITVWNIETGLTPFNEEAKPITSRINGNQDPALVTGNPAEMLRAIKILPEKAITIMQDAHKFIDDPSIIRGIMNCRDIFKRKQITLFLIGSSFIINDDLKDIWALKEEYPNRERIQKIITDIQKAAGIKELPDIEKLTDILTGLSAFSAEQTLATCVYKDEKGIIDIDRNELWEQKCLEVQKTQGLKMKEASKGFDKYGGGKGIKSFFTRLMKGNKPFKTVVFIDEVEKFLGNAMGDSSGTKADQLGVWLKEMDNPSCDGVILVSPPGCGKSFFAECLAYEAKTPFINYDGGGMQDKLVGESGRKTREAAKVINAISGGETLYVFTSNDISILPPELKRRCTLGTFYFEFPSTEERKEVWNIHIKGYELTKKQIDSVNDENWTPAEIRNCCKLAYKLNCKLSEAAIYISPVYITASDKVEKLRREADGIYLSANEAGIYKRPMGTESNSIRKFN